MEYLNEELALKSEIIRHLELKMCLFLIEKVL